MLSLVVVALWEPGLGPHNALAFQDLSSCTTFKQSIQLPPVEALM